MVRRPIVSTQPDPPGLPVSRLLTDIGEQDIAARAAGRPGADTGAERGHGRGFGEETGGPRGDECCPETGIGETGVLRETVVPDPDRANQDWAERDWESPASTFRPDPRAGPSTNPHTNPLMSRRIKRLGPRPGPGDHSVPGRSRTEATADDFDRCGDLAQSLFGFSNTPGQLMDRSSLVPAEAIRDMAQQKGTLFYRLLTDETGNLLDVTEPGRFPSRKLGMAVKFRAGVCQCPTCHTPATGCDIRLSCTGPGRPHHRSQPGSGVPVGAPRQDPCRASGDPDRIAHHSVDHTFRTRLHGPGPATSRRTMAPQPAVDPPSCYPPSC